MRTRARMQKIIDHLDEDLNSRLDHAGLVTVKAWGCYRVDDNRGEHDCIGTVSLLESNIDEDTREGSVFVELRLPVGVDDQLDEYVDCIIESLDEGDTFDDAFLETSVTAEEKWPTQERVHPVVVVQLGVRINRLY